VTDDCRDHGMQKETRRVQIHRLDGVAGQSGEDHDRVAVERPLAITVKNVRDYRILCTPSDIEALAVGFIFSEGIIDSADDIARTSQNAGEPSIEIELTESARATRTPLPAATELRETGGGRSQGSAHLVITPRGRTLKMSLAAVMRATREMQSMQSVFRATGGTHGAGIFDADQRIIAFAEDIGRHSALDKAIGKCLLAGRSRQSCGVALSGRVSFEMVSKAARAGLELIAAVSAPSSLAIEAASQWRITLCGFVRPERANVYTHPERITDIRTTEQRAGTGDE